MKDSTTAKVGESGHSVPRHVAIIMDGNGRWAHRRAMPRHAGHRAGVKSVRQTVETAAKRGVTYLTLFAFSSENWSRPREEVSRLMGLFLEALQREVKELHRNKVRLSFIGAREQLQQRLNERISEAEQLTADNDGLRLQVAVAYGGRWDLINAARSVAERVQQGKLMPAEIDENMFSRELQLCDIPDPDLLIRTGGEQRISNFLLWNLAYAELYFSDRLWPDFRPADFDDALAEYARRQRRFGNTPDKVGVASA